MWKLRCEEINFLRSDIWLGIHYYRSEDERSIPTYVNFTCAPWEFLMLQPSSLQL